MLFDAVMVGAIDRLSETGLLIDDALRQVRAGARLDDDPVLPPLPSVAPRREAIVISRDALFERVDASKPKKDAALGATTPTTKLRAGRRGKRWPLVLCAFVALGFASEAFLASPFAARPQVKHAIDASRAETAAAVHSIAALVHR